MHADGDWQAVQKMLTKDMATVGEYLQTWKLKLSTTKTLSTDFHLNNEILPLCFEPKCLGVTLDRLLTYRPHLESLRKKLTSRVALLRWLPGSGWGAGATTLQIATLALVHSTAEYCSPVWCCSAHTRLIDHTINNALQIVTGCLRRTPADSLPTLAGIQPAELRRSGATLSLARCAMEPGHLLHSAHTRPSSANAQCLKSRHPFVPPHNISSVHLTTTYMRYRGWITNGRRSGWTIPQDSALSSPTTAPTPGMTLAKRGLGPV